MNHITINGQNRKTNLEREIKLNNGSLVFLKNGNKVNQVYMVVSFRDNKNRYNYSPTTAYCSLLNLDTGNYEFEERCSRNTTVRRLLNHLLMVGSDMSDEKYRDYDVEIHLKNNYRIDIIV